ncbi:Uncharacterised protein [uncultured Avibacterium sp.]|uniref:Uncharacterized protein n=1 Tax=uncultured Avibacterium sp. TaxID=1936169 RepID=A0A486XDM3_9PAST|nr:Uncharacterised protein [uncultured Avibacterium sp.]
MNAIKNKHDNDFYSLLDSFSINELEEFIGETEETGLAYTLSVDFFYDILESEKDFIDISETYIKHVKKSTSPIVQNWINSKPIKQTILYKKDSFFLCNDTIYEAAA